MSASAERILRRGRLHAAAICSALVATLIAGTAAGAPSRAEVNVHGSVDEVRVLEATLRSLFPADAPLEVSAVESVSDALVMNEPPTPPVDDVVARAWIELHDGARVTIYVADVSGERLLVRHLPRNDRDPELTREATARVVATALEALLSGAQIGVERAQVDEQPAQPERPVTLSPAAPAPPQTTATSAVSFTLGAQYGMQLFSPQVPVLHGPGLMLGGSFGKQRTRAGAVLIGQIWWPVTASDAVSRERVLGSALRLMATLERSFGASVGLSAGLGGGFDLTRVDPAAGNAAVLVRLASPTTLTTPALRVSLGARFHELYGLSLYTTLALDLDPSRTRYVSLNDGVATAVLTPHALRPSLVVGVATP